MLWMIARETFAMVRAGSAAGLVLAIAASRVLAEYLNGVASIDSAIVAACIFGMFLVTAASLAIPAIHGCRVDPLSARRHD